MIQNAEEFVRLRNSEIQEEYTRAAFESISEEIAREVIQKYPDMAIWVVRNKTVPLSILETLAEHPDHMVRAEVASKRKLSRALFEKLALDEVDAVRTSLIANRKLPFDILQQLTRDDDPRVAEMAQRRLKERNA